MKKIIVLNILVLLAGCGPSQEERVNIAQNACAVMGESKKSDSLFRMQTMVDAREKSGGEGFTGGDEAIKEAFKFGICKELVLNESYDELLQSLKDDIRERERIAAEKLAEEKRIAAEKQRIADSKPTVKEEFHEYGWLISRTNYQSVLDGGEKHGLFEQYYKNGQLFITGYYENGQREGLWEEYRESGLLMKKVNYKNGQREGRFEQYHKNLQLFITGYYENGQPEGLWRNYHENGQLRAIVRHNNGQREGRFEQYHNNGQLYIKGTYKKGPDTVADDPIEAFTGFSKGGQLDGRIIQYREDGTLQRAAEYKDGLVDGVAELFDENGKLFYKSNFKKGERDGLAETYTPSGAVLRVKCFKYDQSVILSYCKK